MPAYYVPILTLINAPNPEAAITTALDMMVQLQEAYEELEYYVIDEDEIEEIN